MKKLFEDFKKLDMPMRFALVGTVIAMVGYFFGVVWYSTYKENKEWEEAQQRSMNLHRHKYKKRKKRKNKK